MLTEVGGGSLSIVHRTLRLAQSQHMSIQAGRWPSLSHFQSSEGAVARLAYDLPPRQLYLYYCQACR
ncbi:hypothetical protein BDN72DRAFT_406573 [Pluteus cervinus]|uniref:Uncharacterized protein n=2 Tax=Pluteus cervinus TaxID=181527 RepID=A0ACD3A8V1_9AGAR|nr:hypothetical protein BDN72DRAFT_628152 [Pluteus cervinus]TFK62115.1 hypothetical protein BDN72DRAFT_406573 [Pluteus cervinus]